MTRCAPGYESRETAFAAEYQHLQGVISRLTGDPMPPCCYCSAEQVWSCSKTGDECSVYRHYCADYESL